MLEKLLLDKTTYNEILSYEKSGDSYRIELYSKSSYWAKVSNEIQVPRDISRNGQLVLGEKNRDLFYKLFVEYFIPNASTELGLRVVDTKDYKGLNFEVNELMTKVLKLWNEQHNKNETKKRDGIQGVNGQMGRLDIKE